jgi:hypothetical protein
VYLRNGTGNIFPIPCFEITILFRSLFLRVKFFFVLSFDIHFSFPVPYSETHTIFRILLDVSGQYSTVHQELSGQYCTVQQELSGRYPKFKIKFQPLGHQL